MTFLELCQAVARESGTISGVRPTTTVGQTGREAKIVAWVQESWRRIQTSRRGWLWRRGEFTASIGTGSQRYTATGLAITDWKRWITDADSLTVYLTSTGVSDEGSVPYIDFDRYRAMYERGDRGDGSRPVHWSISPSGELCFPKLDATYTVRGLYDKALQALSEDADEPDMPEDYHDIIVWDALSLLAEHDEGETHIVINRGRRDQMFKDLCADQLPRVSLAGALA